MENCEQVRAILILGVCIVALLILLFSVTGGLYVSFTCWRDGKKLQRMNNKRRIKQHGDT